MIEAMISWVLLAILLLLAQWFVRRRLKTFLKFFQQEEYDAKRFAVWWVQVLAVDQRVSLAVLVCGLIVSTIHQYMVAAPLFVLWPLFAIVAGVAAWYEGDATLLGKKPLKLTARAQRILAVGAMLAVVAAPALALWGYDVAAGRDPFVVTALAAVVWVQLLPVMLVLGNALLWPFEKLNQRRYWHQAHAKIKRLNPDVIGITGSYGKTSTKHILGHILSTHAPTLITPGSVNTPMGVSRIIREKLTEQHKYAIIEMGAYGPGSIDRLCRLTPPRMAIVTAVGWAHYERFKSLETVAHAKAELVHHALKHPEGTAIFRHDLVQYSDYAAARQVSETFAVDGEGAAGTDYLIDQITHTRDGIQFELRHRKNKWLIKAPVFGNMHASNITAAFIAARACGMTAEAIIAALKTLPQITHRLEVKPGNVTFPTMIDDAYNSNPVGFAEALSILSQLHGDSGRRILVTPGMVELGQVHDEKHYELGQLAAHHADVAIVVKSARIPTFISGFKSKMKQGQQMIPVGSFAEANAWLQQNANGNDVVLLENDLPDLYEDKPRF